MQAKGYSNVLGVLLIFLLAVLVIIVGIRFFVATEPGKEYANRTEQFRIVWCGKLIKNACDLSKFSEKEREEFQKMCEWASGKENILLSECKKLCHCSEGAEEFYQQMMGILHGFECNKNLGMCLVSGAGLYSRIVEIGDTMDPSEAPVKVFYKEKDGSVYTCFKLDENNRYFQVKFDDGSALTHLDFAEKPQDMLGEKKIKFVEDGIAQKNYLNMHGIKWICKNNCEDLYTSPTGARIIITKVDRPWACWNCVYKIWLRTEPCKQASEPAPIVDETIYFKKEGGSWEIVRQGETKSLYYLTYYFALKFDLDYKDYYGLATSNVLLVIEMKKDENNYLESFEASELKGADFLGKIESGSNVFYVYECKQMKDKNSCEIKINGKFSRNKLIGKRFVDVGIKTYVYAITDVKKLCQNGYGYFTYPLSISCNANCIKYLFQPEKYVKELVENCEAGRMISFTVEVP